MSSLRLRIEALSLVWDEANRSRTKNPFSRRPTEGGIGQQALAACYNLGLSDDQKNIIAVIVHGGGWSGNLDHRTDLNYM